MKKSALYLVIAIIALMVPRANICSIADNPKTSAIMIDMRGEIKTNRYILAYQIKQANLVEGRDWQKFEHSKKWFTLFEELVFRFGNAVKVVMDNIRIEGAWYEVIRPFDPNNPLQDFAGFSVMLPYEKVQDLKEVVEESLEENDKLIKRELSKDRREYKQYNEFKKKILDLLSTAQDLDGSKQILDFFLKSSTLINDVIKKSLVPTIRMLKKYVKNPSMLDGISIDSFYSLKNDLIDYQADLMTMQTTLFNKLQDYANYFVQEYVKNGDKIPAKLPLPNAFELDDKFFRRKQWLGPVNTPLSSLAK